MRRPTAPRAPLALRALALTGVLALAACTPPQGSASEDSPSDDASPTGSSESSDTASPSPSQSTSTDPGATTRPTDEPQTDGGATDESETGSPFPFVRGLPSGVEEAPADTAAGVGWNEAGDELLVVTFGSSSCPLVPQTVEQSNGGLEITLAPAGGAVCTMDVVPTYATVPPPSGVASDAPVTAVLGDLGQVTVPPAATPAEIGWLAAETG